MASPDPPQSQGVGAAPVVAPMTVVKMDARGRVRLRYPAEVIARSSGRVVLAAEWQSPTRDLDWVRFEPGDRFTEHYFADQWFDVQEVTGRNGRRKGWYCDIAEPAAIESDRVLLIDLDLDVWVGPRGEVVVLDEDEFAANPWLSAAQRGSALQGLQVLLRTIEARRGLFDGAR